MRSAKLRYRDNIIRFYVSILLFQLLQFLPISSLNLAQAANPGPLLTGQVLDANNPISNLNVLLVKPLYVSTNTDSEGKFSIELSEGYNYIFSNFNSNNTDYVNFQLQILVTNNVIVKATYTDGSQIRIVNGVYLIDLQKINVRGNITVGGVSINGYVSSVWNVQNSSFQNFNQVQNGNQYGISIPPGNYIFYVNPSNGVSYPITCTVVVGANSQCDANIPENNLFIKISDSQDQILKTGVYATITQFFQKGSIWIGAIYPSISNDAASASLADGAYELNVGSNNSNVDGMPRKFNFSVTNGLISDLKDAANNSIVSANAKIFTIKLAKPNFIGVITKNGNPQPNAFGTANQASFWQSNSSDQNGKISFSLPDGKNIITVNPNSTDTQSVSSNFTVMIANGVVTAVQDSSGNKIESGVDGYALALQTPNVLGQITENQIGVSGYISNVWNTVTNNWNGFQQRPPDASGNFGLLLPAGNYDIIGSSASGNLGVKNCNANSNTPAICNFEFPSENIKLILSDFNSNLISKDISAFVTPLSITGENFKIYDLPFRYETALRQNIDGSFGGSLLDGKYSLRIDNLDNSNIGVSRLFDLTVEKGKISQLQDHNSLEKIGFTDSTTSISFLKPNLLIKVSANSTPSINSNYCGYNISGVLKIEAMCGVTDKNGYFAKTLPDGEYNFNLNPRGDENPIVVGESFRVVIDSGTVSSFTLSSGETLTAGLANYNVALPNANIHGTINISGSTNFPDYVAVGNFIDSQTATFVNAGINLRKNEYGARLPVGSYNFNSWSYLNIYNPNSMSWSNFGSVISDNCLVSSLTSNNCNVSFPNDNFIYRVLSPNGDVLLDAVTSYISLSSTTSSTSINNDMQTNGIFRTKLKAVENSTYQVTVGPKTSNLIGLPKTYEIRISGETVTAVIDLSTKNNISQNLDGSWDLKLATANIAGNVVGNDGSTPVPNTNVNGQGPIWINSGTDNTGRFAIHTDIDGTYTVWASAPWNDMTKADSDSTTVTVMNGVGVTNINLQLRSPNVKGLVSGPKGVSKNNYIQIMKKDDYGNFQYVSDQSKPRATDGQGYFAFYLNPGTYRFLAQADELNAGGAATLSGDCVITDVSILNNCDFTLRSSNLKIQLISLANSPYTSAWSYFNWSGNLTNGKTPPIQTWQYSSPDSQGVAKFALDDGTWQGRVEVFGTGKESSMDLTVTVANGVVTELKDLDGTLYTQDINGNFKIQLKGSNLLSSVMFNGQKINFGASVQVMKLVGNFYQTITSKWINAGQFSSKVPPGTYSVLVEPYSNLIPTTGSPVRTKIDNCVVPESGIANCDVSLRTGNILGEITNPNGDTLPNIGYAYLTKLISDSNGNVNEIWDQNVNVKNGRFTNFLEDGIYRLQIGPDSQFSGKYTAQSYKIEVKSGLIYKINNFDSNQQILISGDIFKFPLGLPTVTGKVYLPGGNITAPSVGITVFDVNSNQYIWKANSWTNKLGEYSLSLPAGVYDLTAQVWGSGYNFTNSDKSRVTILNSNDTKTVDITLRLPNLKGKVTSPTSTVTGLANVTVYGAFGNQSFSAQTDSNGNFGAFIDPGLANCPTNCTINLYPNNPGKYTTASYSVPTIGDLGNLAIGAINASVSIFTPTNGINGLPNPWAWLAVSEVDSVTSTIITRYGVFANELGVAGLNLTTGKRYQLTAYPSWQFYAQYSPKSIEISSFDPSISSNYSITFNSPNVTLIVQDKKGNPNSWGWYQVYQKNGVSSNWIQNGYLNELGRSGISLDPGDYEISIYPGKTAGVESKIMLNISSSNIATSSNSDVAITNNVAIIKLPDGNISGIVYAKDGVTPVSNIPITAVKDIDSSTVVTAITQKDGSFSLNLNLDFSWTLNALDPITLNTGTLSLSATTPSNKSIPGQNITLK